jgi:hypothetical protein
VNEIYYQCHNCGSVHEIEGISRNLKCNGHAIGDVRAAQRAGVLRLGSLLARRRVTRVLMRGLWPN